MLPDVIVLSLSCTRCAREYDIKAAHSELDVAEGGDGTIVLTCPACSAAVAIVTVDIRPFVKTPHWRRTPMNEMVVTADDPYA